MKNIYNIPNMITFVRFILIFFFIQALWQNNSVLALLLFFVIFLGDGIDGLLARKLKQETNFGKVFDGLTDGIVTYAALILITIQGKLSLIYLIFLILPRLLSVLGIVVNYFRYKKFKYETSKYRRMSALLVYILIFLAIIMDDVSIAASVVIIATYSAMLMELFGY